MDKEQLTKQYEEHTGGKDVINLVVIGHVDAGKSTLMGHLLYQLGQVSQKQMHKYKQESQKIGKGSFAFAWVLDETEEERFLIFFLLNVLIILSFVRYEFLRCVGVKEPRCDDRFGQLQVRDEQEAHLPDGRARPQGLHTQHDNRRRTGRLGTARHQQRDGRVRERLRPGRSNARALAARQVVGRRPAHRCRQQDGHGKSI